MLDSVREASSRAKAAVESGLEVFDDGYLKGVSPNLCEAVDDMFVDGYFEAIELRPRLSQVVVSSPRETVRVQASSAPILSEAAERLKEISRTSTRMSITGRVTDLHRSSPDSDETVTVTTLIDGKKRTINMGLNVEQYAQAIRAHEDGLPVISNGDLVMRGNRSWLSDLRHFGSLTTERCLSKAPTELP